MSSLLPRCVPDQYEGYDDDNKLWLMMIDKRLGLFVLGVCLLANVPALAQETKGPGFPTTRPAFKVDYTSPTTDKPQSKLWYWAKSWWALLPRSSGPSLWQRTETGWQENRSVGKALTGIPGRADVWADADEVTAVSVADTSLTVFRLTARQSSSEVQWHTQIMATLMPPVSGQAIETATIAQDKTGRWWVAADAGTSICVWSAPADGKNWSAPHVLTNGIGEDDICTIAVVPGGVGVIWSDQVRDQITLRKHLNGRPTTQWESPEIAEAGNKTADDHLNTALGADSTLWVVTKNSVDRVGQPQLVLRIRSPKGQWINRPFANLDSICQPTRPVIIATPDPSLFFAGYTVHDNTAPFRWHIVFSQVDLRLPALLVKPRTVISPDSVYKGLVNDVTAPKLPFPANAPWIVLASDKAGNVYEVDLHKLIKKP